MSALNDIAARHGLEVIEDAAQAHGAEWESSRVGSLGLAAAFSFQSAKNLASGEGGMLTTNDQALFERAFSMHNAGRSRELEARWEHPFLGWNIRATEYQAALLLERFSHFDEEQQRRAATFARLRQLLAGIACVRPLDQHPSVRRHGMYMFVIRYLPQQCGGRSIDEFVAAVNAEGVPLTRCYAATLANQPAMRSLATRRPDYIRALPTPVADRATSEIAYLPSNVFLADASDMEDIAAALDKVGRGFAA
jgi:dTDP-4-amino-4,6-dideoxygalactose transaminase